MYEYHQILSRMRLGASDRQLAKAGIIGRVKAGEIRSIAQSHDWLNPHNPLPDDSVLAVAFQRQSSVPQQESLAKPYEDQLRAWQAEGIQATTIHQALVRNYQFQGSYSSVRRLLQKLAGDNPQATVMLDFDPGDTAQVDFGYGPKIIDEKTGEKYSTWFFVMTLAFSRHQYAELVKDQKIATWLGCHRRAFEFFAGVPTRVMIDNLKAGITKACWHDPVVQRSYAECAEGYGFLISPCPPRDPKKKGRVESGVKYVKRNFMPLREFRSLADANRQLKEWVLETAGTRIHGTTKQQPLTLFADFEKSSLKPLPDVPPELAYWAKHKLHGNCHLQFEKAFYSAPFRLVHSDLWVRASETTVKIFKNYELQAIHPRLHKPGTKSTMQDHLPPEAVAWLMHDPQWCLQQAETIGPCCTTLIKQLFAHRVLDNLRAAQGVVGFAKSFGAQRLEAACERALLYDNPRYQTIKTILSKGIDLLQADPPIAALSAAYTGEGRFCRPKQTNTIQ
jgi:transposase